MKRLISLCILLQFAMSALTVSKDSIYISQFVKNSFTQYGVNNALVTVMDATGCIIDTVRTQPGSGGHDAQVWSLTVPRRKSKFRIRVEHPDYMTGEMTVEMKHPARLNSFSFPDMLLESRYDKSLNLGGVEVVATRVKLCYKGDTIEVNARAFDLTEGSMLESLVKNVPGCELKDNGEIYMNGKKVDYLTLNGKDFFKGDNRIMLDNLPYYTVDKLQFFNKRNERSEMMGKDVERPDFVMNVKLKQEYNIGYLGNVETGAGTEERWMGRAFALRFTDNSRISLYGNANNVNNTRSPGGDGGWAQMDNPVGENDTYNAGGEWLTDDKKNRYKEVLKVSLQWNKSRNEQRTATQQFIQDGDIFGYSGSASTNQTFSLKTGNHLTLKRIGLISDSRFEYSSFDRNGITRKALVSEQLQEGTEQVLDSVFCASQSSEIRNILVNRERNEATASGSKWEAEQNFDFHKSLPWGDDLMLTAKGLWNGANEDGNGDYWLEYANGETPNDIQKRLTNVSSHSYQLKFGVNYAIHFLTDWHLCLGVAHNHQHSDEQNDLYRLDWYDDSETDNLLPSVTDYLSLLDASNSPHNVSTRREEHITGSLHRHKYDSQRGRFFSFTASLDASYTSQSGTYSRGENIANLSDHRWLFNPSVNLEYQTRNWHDTYTLHYDTKMQALNLAQTADMTDTSNPLATQKGNPDLRPSTEHTLSLMYSSRFGTHGQFIMLRSAFSIMQNLVAMNSIYDATRGAYTYVPVNVNGNWTNGSSVDIRRALTSDRSLNMESQTSYKYIHSVDMKDNTTSTVKQHMVGQNLKFEYKHRLFTVSLLGGISWNGLRSASTEDINSFNFNYGTVIQADLPLKMHFSSDIKMYSRRGYADPSMCTDNLVWNAQIDRSFCRGRLLVAAKTFDLLRQISSIYTTFNSQGRTETWQLSLPSYLMVSVQYKFNKNPKKK